MAGYEWIGFLLTLTLTFVIGGVIAVSRLRGPVKVLLLVALLLRVAGAYAKYFVLHDVYGGVGDAVGYYERGLEIAAQFMELDFRAIWDPTEWQNGRWWGTNFVFYPAAVVLGIIGPSMLGGFVIFALFGLVGLTVYGLRVVKTVPQINVQLFLLLLWFWPSLWFWPASIGKDAIVLLGVTLAIAGFIGDGRRIGWFALAAGLLIIFVIRPQVAAVLAVACLIAQWFAPTAEWNARRIAQGVLLAIGGLVLVYYALLQIGIQGFDVDAVEGYLSAKGEMSRLGGSAVETYRPSLWTAPLTLINVWFRPFVWEGHLLIAASGAEMLLLWTLIFLRRRSVLNALRSWQTNRIVRLAIIFVLTYSVLLGLAAANLSIISRQRIFIFPLLFLLIAWDGRRQRRPARMQPARRYAPPTPSQGQLAEPVS